MAHYLSLLFLDAFDNQLILKTLQDILEGNVCQIPLYDFKTNSRREDEFVTIYPADVVLFEGILVFYLAEIRDFFHMKLFVDTDADTRLSRRGKLHLVFFPLPRLSM